MVNKLFGLDTIYTNHIYIPNRATLLLTSCCEQATHTMTSHQEEYEENADS